MPLGFWSNIGFTKYPWKLYVVPDGRLELKA